MNVFETDYTISISWLARLGFRVRAFEPSCFVLISGWLIIIHLDLNFRQHYLLISFKLLKIGFCGSVWFLAFKESVFEIKT